MSNPHDILNPDAAEMRLSEANHRIANSLSAIAGIVRLQANDDARVQQLRSPQEVKRFLNEVGSRIDTASVLHRLLSTSVLASSLDLSAYLLSVAKTVVATNGARDSVSVIYELGAQCRIDSDDALALGLIVGELITNSLKYAHPTGVRGQILFSCRTEENDVVIEVADDGVGLPQGLDFSTATSLGLRLIRNLCAQIGAEFSLTDEGLGARAIVRMPLGV